MRIMLLDGLALAARAADYLSKAGSIISRSSAHIS